MNFISNVQRYLDRNIIAAVTKRISKRVQRIAAEPFGAQDSMFRYLISKAKDTQFGLDHGFKSIGNYEAFKSSVPLRTYEAFTPYINQIVAGEQHVLWPGKPVYFAYTSGTTSGTKYIPITTDFIPPYVGSARNAVSMYIAETGNISCITGKLLFFTHNIEIDRLNGIPVRPIAGIAQAYIPRFFRSKFLPSDETNRIEDFEKNTDISVQETVHQDVTLISGISPWVQLYFNKLTEKTGKVIKDIFPNFSVRVHGGVNDQPYRATLEGSIGKKVDTIELYPSTEGFIAFQDSQKEPGLLLNLQGGIFYEFVPADEILSDNPTRISLRDVELNVNYAIILNNNAGLWGYSLGDIVKFISRNPFRLVITGRTTHFVSTTGEHLIAGDVEAALADISSETGARTIDFIVAPQIHPESGLPYHEWFIEFEKQPPDLDRFASRLNTLVGNRNINYQEFCEAKIMLHLEIKVVCRGGFVQYMKSIGKLGGQNKVPHLSNDRKMADALMKYVAPCSKSGKPA